MPNENLITQVDTQREIVIQQQKSITSTQAAFKAFADATGKIQKSLRDYTADVSVESAQAAFGGLRIKDEVIDPLLPDFRRELKSLTVLAGALKDASLALRSEPADVVKLDKAVTALQTSSAPNLINLMPELEAELEVAQRALGDEFGQKLRDALAEQGIAISGRSPKFEIGRFELEANFAKRFAVLRYGKDTVVPRVSITVEAVVKAYQSAAKAVTGRNVEGKTWLAQFYEAYQNARRKRNDSNARVNIVDAYVELVLLNQGRGFFIEPGKRTFKDYSRAEFIHDFYEFSSRQHLSHSGQTVKAHAATKSQTDNPAKSMWVVEGDSPYDGRYIADIEFVKE